nr:unnamed protein product [Callosobruchus analis]
MTEEFNSDDLIPKHGIPRLIYERQEYFDTMDAVTFQKSFQITKAYRPITPRRYPRKTITPIFPNSSKPVIINAKIAFDWRTPGCCWRFCWCASFNSLKSCSESDRSIGIFVYHIHHDAHHIQQIRQTQQDFYSLALFPSVIGAIDCTHCRIASPGMSRYMVYGANVMLKIVCILGGSDA